MNKKPPTIDTAEEILQWQLSLEANEMDMELMQACVRSIDPEFVEKGVPFEAEVWGRIRRDIEKMDQSAAKPVFKTQTHHYPHFCASRVAAVVIIAVLVAGNAIAAVLGIDIWSFTLTWNDDELIIEGEMQKTEWTAIEEAATWCRDDEFGALVLNYNFLTPLPTIPGDYELVESIDLSSDGMRDVYAMYKKADMHISINIYSASSDMATLIVGYEKDAGDPIIIEYGEIQCYYFTNTNFSVAVYDAGDCWVDLGSSLPLQELQKIVETMR